MAGIIAWFNGKKTYITAILIGVFACLNALGIVVPEFVYFILTALGLTFVRSAVK
jgi:hypothetical protein